MNIHWLVQYKVYVVCSDPKLNIATSAYYVKNNISETEGQIGS